MSVIQEAKYEECPTCHSRKCISDEMHGCDQCKRDIDTLSTAELRPYLRLEVFSHVGHTKHMHFCSWKCCLKKLRSVKCDYFISLPFLTFDEKTPGLRPRDFFALMKKGRA